MKKGFTLIELLVVISIISLLTSVILSGVDDSRKKAKASALKQNLVSLRTEGELFMTSNNVYAPGEKGGACPSVSDNSWGFLGTLNGLKIINKIEEYTDSNSLDCYVNKESWAVSSDVYNLAFNEMRGNVAYAETIGYLCTDSSGSIVYESSCDGSDGVCRTYSINKDSKGLWRCKI